MMDIELATRLPVLPPDYGWQVSYKGGVFIIQLMMLRGKERDWWGTSYIRTVTDIGYTANTWRSLIIKAARDIMEVRAKNMMGHAERPKPESMEGLYVS